MINSVVTRAPDIVRRRTTRMAGFVMLVIIGALGALSVGEVVAQGTDVPSVREVSMFTAPADCAGKLRRPERRWPPGRRDTTSASVDRVSFTSTLQARHLHVRGDHQQTVISRRHWSLGLH